MQITCATTQIETWINWHFPLVAQITPEDHLLPHTFMLRKDVFLKCFEKVLSVFSKLKIYYKIPRYFLKTDYNEAGQQRYVKSFLLD